MHQAGQTDEAKSDLARLKRVREERAAAQLAREQADGAHHVSFVTLFSCHILQSLTIP
jgi:hypothetical protein